MSLNTDVFLSLNAAAGPSPAMQLVAGTLAFSPVLLEDDDWGAEESLVLSALEDHLDLA